MTRPRLTKEEHAARKARENALCKLLWNMLSADADAKLSLVQGLRKPGEAPGPGLVYCHERAASLEELVLRDGSFMGVFERPSDYIAQSVLDTFPERGLMGQCFKNAFEAVVALQGNTEVAAVRYCEGFAMQEGLPFPVHHAWTQLKLYGEKTWRVYDPTWPADDKGLPRMTAYRGMAFNRMDVWNKIADEKMYGGMLLGPGEMYYEPVFSGKIKHMNTDFDLFARLPPPLSRG